LQNFGAEAPEEGPDPRPDLVIEIVVSHPEHDALAACEALGVPEVWVWDVPRDRLTFRHLVGRGKNKGKYLPSPRSRALPFLQVSEVAGLIREATADFGAFNERCRAWAEQD